MKLHDKTADLIYKNAKKAVLPEKVDAMKATLTDDRFSDDEWHYERKLDGERLLIRGDGGEVTLMSRNHEILNDTYPELEAALSDQEGKWWLDGEVVAFESDITSFSKLQNRMHLSSREAAEASQTKVYLYIFDCLFADGYDLRKLPLKTRKQAAKQVINYEDPLRFLPHRRGGGLEYYNQACEKGWEGVIAKDRNSEYSSSRSTSWLKFKCSAQQELIIVGYTPGEGERTYFGALLLAFYGDESLHYAGKVGTGFDEKTRADLMQRMEQLERKTSPLDENVNEKQVQWLTPKLVAEIGFSEWTENDKLRHPRYLGLRRDKDAEDVVKEQP